MHSTVLLVIISALSVYSNVLPEQGYHATIGIPLAKEIKETEDALNDVNDERIVGGAVSALTAHPYQAGLVINFVNIAGTSVCGSTLLSTNRLVTAAHCWFDGVNQASQFTVVLGSQTLFSGGTRIITSNVTPHPWYNAFVSNLLNDVAMIFLPTTVTYSTVIQPVALPNSLELWDSFYGEWATAVGYGKTSDLEVGVSTSTVRREVNLQIITNAQCTAVYGSIIQNSNICTSGAGNVGICGGDSGGPLTVVRNGQRRLVGISSFVANQACHMGHPSGFARVTSFYDFIITNLY